MKVNLPGSVFAFVVFLFVALFNPNLVKATATLYLTPANSSITNGQNLAISIRVNSSGSTMNGVQVNLSYPVDKLEFQSIDSSNSAFGLQAENSGGSGIVRIARALNGGQAPINGDYLIAVVNFKAVSNGSAGVSFDSGSQVASSGQNILGTSTGGTYTINSPTTPPASTPPPTTSNNSSQNNSSKTTTPTQTPSSTGKTNYTPKEGEKLKITAIKVTDLGLQQATITWQTNKPATSIVNYSQQKALKLSASNSSLVTSHKVVIDSSTLLPGTVFFFKVSSVAAGAERVEGEVSTFKTKGYTVKVKITDKSGKLLKGVTVVLYSDPQETRTDNSGIATFTDVSPEKHSVVVKTDGQTFAQEIDVKETATPLTAQSYSVKTQKIGSANLLFGAYLALVVLVTVLLGVIVWLAYKNKLNQNSETTTNGLK